MLKVEKHGVVLEHTQLGFENEDVLNPGAIQIDDKVHLFYRAVSKGNHSSIGYCRLNGPLTVEERHDVPLIFPQCDYEAHGIEDARITQIDGLYYLTYTAFDGINALGALATSTDLVHFEKQGIITAQITYDDFRRLAACKCALNEKYARFNDRNRLVQNSDKKVLLWDKNLIFFPRRINGKLYFMHRIKPDIQIACVPEIADLNKAYWENYFLHFCDNIAMTSKHSHEISYIGGGCPPIETDKGWLIIYHGVYDTTHGYVYSACAALLDLENPLKEIARLPYPLFKPEEHWELLGEVNNVCFPTGTALFGDTLYIYYGAADERVACASVSLSGLLRELLSL
jgi:beta-1,2-mannobiose phosphorylase / 1,2-beta-oligomannan phosphorylase